MASFEWISPRALPVGFDLRFRGWRLADDDEPVDGARVALVDTSAAPGGPEAFAPGLRQRGLALALACSQQRAAWLALGFADALSPDAGLGEIEQRALRVLAAMPAHPGTRRQVGALWLDLIERDARCAGRRLYLHPREFALLWRLSDANGEPVRRLTLLRDVWQLRHAPETNSVAVHVCRLRRKLAAAGLASLIQTEPGDAGYRLLIDEQRSDCALSIRLADEKPLDATRGMRELTAAGSARLSP